MQYNNCYKKKMKRPNKNWINDWKIREMPLRETEISYELLNIFIKFWNALNLDNKSKSTQNRYSLSLQALGGYIVENSIEEEYLKMNATEILNENIGPTNGPLVYDDNEEWQKEFDMVCRKLYKYNEKKL